MSGPLPSLPRTAPPPTIAEPIADARRERPRDDIEQDIARAIGEADERDARERPAPPPELRHTDSAAAPPPPHETGARAPRAPRQRERESEGELRAGHDTRAGRAATHLTEGPRQTLRGALDHALLAHAGPAAKRSTATHRHGAAAGAGADEGTVTPALPSSATRAPDEARRAQGARRAEAVTVPDGAGASAEQRSAAQLAPADPVTPVTPTRAALFDAETLLHGALGTETARVTVDVGGEALHLFVRIHDGVTDVRASGAVPADLERGLRASLLGEGMRLDNFTSHGGDRQPGAGVDERDAAATPRRSGAAAPTGEGDERTCAAAQTGVNVSVRA